MIPFDHHSTKFASHRNLVLAKNGMVATGSSLASSAGLEILRKGGNAVDAAIATAAALTVVEPTANGLGGDCFAIVWINKKIFGLNASGFSPANLTLSNVRKKHGDIEKMPMFDWTPVMVPGQIKGWEALSKKFGKLSLSECLQPAIRYATEGYPVGTTLAAGWKASVIRYLEKEDNHPRFDGWKETFLFDGKAPEFGDIVKLPDHGKTLELIAKFGSDVFYKGELADRIVEESKKYSGFFEKSDLEEYDIEWVEPISSNYRGYTVLEIPANSQGAITLMALNILKQFELKNHQSIDTIHKQIEATKMAFADGLEHISDPRITDINHLLSDDYGVIRSKQIKRNAQIYTPLTPHSSGTVYLATADNEGNMVSFIQSNYTGFGSGMVVPGTGIAMNNRGAQFSLNENHINVVASRKKTLHTIIPGFLMKNGEAIGPFGIMGGFMQPQAHLQVLSHMIDFQCNPQVALDVPRWQWIEGKKIWVEESFDPKLMKQLIRRGHEVEVSKQVGSFGRGQVIIRLKNGTLVGGCESRTDSNIACY
jgi:gamma-glutamyltranspeptidase / glutathione hydrolase